MEEKRSKTWDKLSSRVTCWISDILMLRSCWTRERPKVTLPPGEFRIMHSFPISPSPEFPRFRTDCSQIENSALPISPIVCGTQMVNFVSKMIIPWTRDFARSWTNIAIIFRSGHPPPPVNTNVQMAVHLGNGILDSLGYKCIPSGRWETRSQGLSKYWGPKSLNEAFKVYLTIILYE